MEEQEKVAVDGEEVVPETLEQAEQLTDMQIMQARIDKFSRIVKDIEEILVREELTWGEWGAVVEMFSARIGNMVSVIKVNKTE